MMKLNCSNQWGKMW